MDHGHRTGWRGSWGRITATGGHKTKPRILQTLSHEEIFRMTQLWKSYPCTVCKLLVFKYPQIFTASAEHSTRNTPGEMKVLSSVHRAANIWRRCCGCCGAVEAAGVAVEVKAREYGIGTSRHVTHHAASRHVLSRVPCYPDAPLS